VICDLPSLPDKPGDWPGVFEAPMNVRNKSVSTNRSGRQRLPGNSCLLSPGSVAELEALTH
jgi:hypothetical protein